MEKQPAQFPILLDVLKMKKSPQTIREEKDAVINSLDVQLKTTFNIDGKSELNDSPSQFTHGKDAMADTTANLVGNPIRKTKVKE